MIRPTATSPNIHTQIMKAVPSHSPEVRLYAIRTISGGRKLIKVRSTKPKDHTKQFTTAHPRPVT